MSQDFSSRSSSLLSAHKHKDTIVPLPSSQLDSKQHDKKEEKKLDQFPVAAAFKFAVSFPELEKLTEHLVDKTEIRAILAKIQKGMQEIEGFFPIKDQNLYYPEIRARLEVISRWLEKIPATAGFHYSIRTQLQTAISPLQKDIFVFFLQEEGLSTAQLVAGTQALYAQQAFVLRKDPIKKALIEVLQAIQQVVGDRVGQRCFISYAWPLQTTSRQEKEGWLQPFLRELHSHLTQAGIKPRLDIVDNQAGGNIVTFTNQIKASEFAVLICTESLLDKHNHPQFKVVQMELSLLRQKYDADIATGQVRVFPFLVSGNRATATLPEHHLYRTVRDWRVNGYIKNLEHLITWIYYPQGTPDAYQKIWQDFYVHYPALANPMPEDDVQKELSLHWHRREMDKLELTAFYQGLLSQQHQLVFSPSSHAAETKETKEAKVTPRLSTPTTLSYRMPRPVEGFVGRVELLNILATQFGASEDQSGERETKEAKRTKENKSSTAASPRRLVLCTGLGGVGKTQLALRYAETATKAYTNKFWFAADNPNTLNAGYRLFAKDKGLVGETYVPDEKVISAVNQWFASQPNWLIIFDNVEHYEDIAPYLPTQGAGDILLTSRLAPIKWPKSITAIAVDALSIDEANQLIASLIASLIDTPNDANIPKLATLLGCLPLALVQASAYISNNAISVADYLKLYEAYAKYLLEQSDIPPNFPAHGPVFITCDINLDAIAKAEKAKGKRVSAKNLLQFCAFLSPQKIPSSVIETWHKGTYPNTPEPFHEVRGQLQAYSLIQLHNEDQSIQVHRLVQQVMQERLTPVEQRAQISQVLQWLTAANPEEGGNQPADQAWQAFLPHLEAVIEHHKQSRCADDPSLAIALGQLGSIYVSLLGQPAKSCVLYKRALAIKESHYGKDHYQVAMTLNNLGNAYGKLGQVGKQRELLERALPILEAYYGKDHYQVAMTLNNLGAAYYALGDVNKSRETWERALPILEAYYGKDHYQVAMTLNNLGNAYGGLGQVGKQRELLERTLAIKEAHYGKDHYQVASTLMNLGTAYGDLGQVDKQRELLERALAIKGAHYGKDHYQVAMTLNNLGNAYGDLGQVDKQRELLERALAIKEAHYGKDHYEVASTLVNLGTAYYGQGKVSKAQGLWGRALPILEAHYGNDHYQVATVLNNLGNAYGALGQVSKARDLLERVLVINEAHYGFTHPELASTLASLAIVYRQLNQPQAALRSVQRAYRILTSHSDYGVTHPLTKECVRVASACGFTLAMLQGSDAISEEKEPTKSSVPVTSPSPLKSHVVDKTHVSAFPIGSNADRLNKPVEFQVSYNPSVHRYFSDLAEVVGHHQGRSLITVQDATTSAGTLFTVSLSAAWLKQVHQGNQKGFHEICHWLNVPENVVLAKIGLVELDNRERKENKAEEISSMLVTHSRVSPSLSSRTSTPGYMSSSSTTTSMVPPSNLTELFISKREEELIERLSILSAQRDRIHKLKSEGHSHSKLDKEQEEMDKQILGVESELQNIKSKQPEQRDNQNRAALSSLSSSLTSNTSASLFPSVARQQNSDSSSPVLSSQSVRETKQTNHPIDRLEEVTSAPKPKPSGGASDEES